MAQTKIFSDQILDPIATKTGATGTVTHDLKTGSAFYHSNLSANFTINFTNVPTDNNRAVNAIVFMDQGSSAFKPTAVQIEGVDQTINWANGITPTAKANKKEVAAFTLIRVGSAWVVLANYASYG